MTLDVDFVVTSDGQLPTRDNSQPLNGADGRGSCVWFNQATMHQTSELGYHTVAQAKAAGASTRCDAESLINGGFFPQ